jgi:hypothetical protein
MRARVAEDRLSADSKGPRGSVSRLTQPDNEV